VTDGDLPLEDRVERHLEANPEATVPAIAGALGESPAAVAEVLDEDINTTSGAADVDETPTSEADETRFETTGDHENPVDVADVTDAERAQMLREYLEAFVDAFGDVPRLMPLDEEGKAPIIQGRARLDSPEGRDFLVDGDEAIRQIREDGARGFAIYAGKWDHNTEDVVFVDHDDDAFPCPTADPTLEVLSGSGRGKHETYRNAGDVANARVGDNLGEIRAENWYVVAPGSVHPTGGVYHMVEQRDVATLADDDLDDSMRPAANRRDRDDQEGPTAEDLDTDGETPDGDTIQDRLERAFANSHDGDRIEQVYNGRYRAAGFDDRSAAEFWLANRLDAWVARGDRGTVRRLMDQANLQKWPDRPDRSYRDSVLSEVGHQDWYYDPDYDGDQDGDAGDRHPLLQEALDRGDDVDGGPTSTLPLDQLDALSPQARKRAASKRGLDWPSTDDARDQLFDTITQAMRHGDQTVVDAPTSLGKSFSVATTRWGVHDDVTGEKPVVHLSATRDARDEAAQASREHGGEHFVLKSRHEACPVAAGDHDPREAHECDDEDRQPITMDGEPASEWLDRQCEGKGLPFSAAHQYLADHNDQGVALPCGGDSCYAIRQWDEYREGEWPLVIATHNFAHVPSLRAHTNVVIDEEPDFTQDLSKDRIARAITAYLQAAAAPVKTWETFISLVGHKGWGGDAGKERDQLRECLDYEPDREWYLDEPDAHTLAPALARAIFHAEDRGNGRRVGKTPHEPPRLDANAADEDGWNRVWVTVAMDADNDIRTVRTAPDFGQARSVVGLDAHPAEPVWAVNTVPNINTTEVLDPQARRLWRRYERGLRVVQVGEATRPLASGEYFQRDQLATVVDHLREAYGDDFRTAITASAVEPQVQDILQDAGVDDVDERTMHYGEEKSRNDFADERVGLVEGSIDPGDDYVLDLLAELDLDAAPETVAVDGDKERAHGRGFEGPDADTAQAILASVRENHTAQAAGRYARNPDDPESHATVFVRTDAMPTDFADVQVDGVEWTFTETQRAIVATLRESVTSLSAREVADDVDVSKEHVRGTLQRLVDLGAVQALNDAGDHGATLYADDGLPTTGVADLETTNDHVLDTYTWSLAIRDPAPTPDAEAVDTDTDDGVVWDWRTATDGGGPPD